MRAGAEATPGHETKKSFDSAGAAKTFVEKEITKKLEDGFVEQKDEAIWVIGAGKKPMRLRVPLSAEKIRIGAYNLPTKRLDLEGLARCKKLRAVDVWGHKLESIDLGVFARCAALEELSLMETGLPSVDLAPLARCTKLRSLALMHFKTAPDLTPLAKCKALSTLKLMNNAFARLDLSPLRASASLTRLHLQFCPKLKSVDISGLRAEVITCDGTLELVGEDSCSATIKRFD